MSDHELAEIAPTLSAAEQERLVLRYWRRGDLTPLPLANSLAHRPRRPTNSQPTAA
jgi:hypothetical protein